MGELRNSGSTSIKMRPIGVDASGPARDEFLEAVQEAAQGDYEVFGEIGRGVDQSVVYLARDLHEQKLVALRLAPVAPDASGSGEFLLDVVKELDPSLPAMESSCPQCHSPIRKWGRFCTQCGGDLSGVGADGTSDAELMAAVQETAGDDYEILGEMSRAEGGGFVYFARERRTGKLVALRLLKEGKQEFSLGLTTVLKSVADSVNRPAVPLPQAPVVPNSPPVHAVSPAPPSGMPPPPAPSDPPQRPVPPPRSNLPPTTLDRLLELLRQPMIQASILVAVLTLFMLVCSGRS